jgi:primosomal protein N' (replication factor Y)
LERAAQFGFAEVLVETGIPFISEVYSYAVPAFLDSECTEGCLIQVDFRGSKKRGYILKRNENSSVTGEVKFIEKVLSPIPLYKGSYRQVIEKTSSRYGCNPWSLLSHVVPKQSKAVEKNFLNFSFDGVSSNHKVVPKPQFHSLQSHTNISAHIEMIISSSNDKQILIVLPDTNQIESLVLQLSDRSDINYLTSHVKDSERYSAFLNAMSGKPGIYIGNRSAIFTPLGADHHIFIMGDSSFAQYETRFPHWNVRDIAILRAEFSPITFLAFSPSSEVARLVDLGWITSAHKTASPEVQLVVTTPQKSELAAYKSALQVGDLLVVVPQSGFINSLSCAKCRNVARCECGGKLCIDDDKHSISCTLCHRMWEEWKCSYCQHSQIRHFIKGHSRVGFEVAKSLPGVSVIVNKPEKPIHHWSHSTSHNSVVVTYWNAPISGSFAAIAFTDLERSLNGVGLRSEENALEELLTFTASLKRLGMFITDLPHEHPVISALRTGKISEYRDSLLAERHALQLTPYVRFSLLFGKEEELAPIAEASKQLGIFTHVTFDALGENSRIIFRSPVNVGDQLGQHFQELTRLHHMKTGGYLKYVIDPYDIPRGSEVFNG